MRQEKQYLSDGIVQQMGENPSFFLIRHEGLSANTINSFRNEVVGLGGEVEFVKKRILVKAAEGAGCSLTLEQLPGHIGLVFGGEDPLPVAKHVFKFRKDFEEKLEVLGGRFEGQFYSGADVEALSKLPGKDEMRAQLLGTFEAPMAQTLSVVQALLTSVMHCLQNKSEKV